ncbi:glycosyltransferase [Pseudomonas stutzeri]|nr:glycosyltransferase [Stutzerimonas stutzeri]
MPLISVLLAARNAENYIGQTIASILDSTFPNFEIVVVVNCSEDSTLSIVKSFCDARVRVFETNIGQLSFNLNFALQNARGRYIARIDADDMVTVDRFEKQVAILEASLSDVVGSNLLIIDSASNETGECLCFPEKNNSIRRAIFYRSVLAHPTIMMRKHILLNAGGYLGGRYGQDYDLWLRLMRDPYIRFYNIQEPLVKYRLHEGQSKGNMGSYAEVAGYLFREALISKRVSYLIGSFIYFLKAALR